MTKTTTMIQPRRPIPRYRLQDLVACEVARYYAELLKEPFHVVVGDFQGYDITNKSGSITFELKTETSPIRTGNVCLEVWNTDFNRPSGISGTSASYWLHLVLERDWNFYLYEYEIMQVRLVAMLYGDDATNHRNARLKLVPLPVFARYARRRIPFRTAFYDDLIASEHPSAPDQKNLPSRWGVKFSLDDPENV